MTVEFSAIYANGVFQPMSHVSLPEQTRVNLVVSTLDSNNSMNPSQEAVEEFVRLTESHPLTAGITHYKREELYDRH